MDRESLIRGLRSGDEIAWRQFLEEFGGPIRGVVATLGLSLDDQEDIFQNTCLRVLGRIDSLRDSASLGSWAIGIASHLALDLLRRQSKSVPLDSTDLLPPPPVPVAGIAEEMEQLEDAVRVRDALARIDTRCRDLLTALYLEEPRPSYREISARMGIPMGSIGPNLARCAARLEKLLEPVSNPDPRESRSRMHPPKTKRGGEGS